MIDIVSNLGLVMERIAPLETIFTVVACLVPLVERIGNIIIEMSLNATEQFRVVLQRAIERIGKIIEMSLNATDSL